MRYKLEAHLLKSLQIGFKWFHDVVGLDCFKVEIKSKNNHTHYKAPEVKAELSDANIEWKQVLQADEILDFKQLRARKLSFW